VGPRAGLNAVESTKILPLPGLELRLLGRPARSQSIYRLRSCGSLRSSKTSVNFYQITRRIAVKDNIHIVLRVFMGVKSASHINLREVRD
jgi:hypothetical protein